MHQYSSTAYVYYFVFESEIDAAQKMGIIINYLLKGKFKNLIIFIPIVIKVNVSHNEHDLNMNAS